MQGIEAVVSVVDNLCVELRGREKPQIYPLRSRGFPVKTPGFDDLHVVVTSSAKQEIRLRSGRDDKR
jgi:hypothetical protein